MTKKITTIHTRDGDVVFDLAFDVGFLSLPVEQAIGRVRGERHRYGMFLVRLVKQIGVQLKVTVAAEIGHGIQNHFCNNIIVVVFKGV